MDWGRNRSKPWDCSFANLHHCHFSCDPGHFETSENISLRKTASVFFFDKSSVDFLHMKSLLSEMSDVPHTVRAQELLERIFWGSFEAMHDGGVPQHHPLPRQWEHHSPQSCDHLEIRVHDKKYLYHIFSRSVRMSSPWIPLHTSRSWRETTPRSAAQPPPPI